jgi:hypothetical protein
MFMKKAFALIVLMVTPTMVFPQGTVSFGNSLTALVKQWTSATDPTLISVPTNGGFVQLIAAPRGTPLPNPLFTMAMAGNYANYSSVSSFLAANPGWAAAVNNGGALPAPIRGTAGLFLGGAYTINNIVENPPAVPILGLAGSLREPGAGATGGLDEAARRLFHFVRDSQPPFEYPDPGCRPNPSSRADA